MNAPDALTAPVTPAAAPPATRGRVGGGDVHDHQPAVRAEVVAVIGEEDDEGVAVFEVSLAVVHVRREEWGLWSKPPSLG